MIAILELIFITVFWCLLVKIITGKGMILESVGNYAEYQVEQGRKIFEPLITCEWCAPSVHTLVGLLIGLLIGIVKPTFHVELFGIYIVVASTSSFLTGAIWNVLQVILKYKDKLDNDSELAKIKYQYYEKAEQLAMFDIKDRKEEYLKKRTKTERAY